MDPRKDGVVLWGLIEGFSSQKERGWRVLISEKVKRHWVFLLGSQKELGLRWRREYEEG